MEKKTKVEAIDGSHEIIIRRDFELPVSLLFDAHVKSDFVEQWMGTNVIQLDSSKFGSFRFVTTDPKGNSYGFSGVIHEIIPNERIIRTFEMENSDFGVQLQVLDFQPIDDQRSKLIQKVVYESVEKRDANLKLPFEFGINMAHNKLEEIMTN